MAASRGWEVVHAYSDVDLSAYRKGVVRPGFEALIEHAQRRDIDVVVCWKIDRLVRSPADFERLWAVFEANDVQLAAVVDPVDTSSELGMLIVRMLVSFARMESVNISTRVRAARESAAHQGRPPSPGRRPFGLTADWSELVEAEADAIRWAATSILAGQSAYAVANQWNDWGLESPSGKPWRSATVTQCLGAPRLAARRIYEGQVVADGKWPRILDDDTFDRLQVVMSDPARRKGGGGPARHLLTGLIRCHCGRPMQMRPNAKGVRRYYCRKEGGGCGSGIHAERTENRVVDMLFQALDSGELARAMDDTDTDGVLEAIRADEAKLDELVEMYADDQITRREWLRHRDKVNKRIEANRRKAQRWAPQIQTLTRDEWEAHDLEWRRGTLRMVFDAVIIGPTVKSGFDVRRIHPIWRV
jgi:site-specific DNA recombinase